MTAILAVLAITTWTRLGAWRHTTLCHIVAAMPLEVDDSSMMQQATSLEVWERVDVNHRELKQKGCSSSVSRPRAESHGT